MNDWFLFPFAVLTLAGMIALLFAPQFLVFWIWDRIRGKKKIPVEEYQKIIESVANRPRHSKLTREILESVKEDDFDLMVVDFVWEAAHHDHSNMFDTVSRMSPGIQAVYSTYCVMSQVNNGGFHQYFFNEGLDWAYMAVEGYELLGAPKHAGLLSLAIEFHLKEESEQEAYYSGNVVTMVDEYAEARKATEMPDELDDLFYELDEEDVSKLAYQYMNNHMDEFITPDRTKGTQAR